MFWLSWLLACSSSAPEPTVYPDLPVHHLAFGGDLCAGKDLNVFVVDPARSMAMFSEAPAPLEEADLTLVNLEGVVASGGWIADKGESRPILYRARPELAGLLADAGVDVVAVANNHAGDYGPAALLETVDLMARAGIDTVGGGVDLAAAAQPVYRQVDDTVVAFVAADLTQTWGYAATETTPGSFVLDPDKAVAALTPVVRAAREHADLVFLTVHWGANFAKEPSEQTRRVGQALIRKAGFDAILGHSAHVLQGMELVDGKPILYDAGNFLAGHTGRDEQAVGLVYDLAFNKAGVVSAAAHPIRLRAGRVVPAKDKTLEPWAKRTRDLGAEVRGNEVVCDPGPLLGRRSEAPPPRPPAPPAEPFVAPRDHVVDALPPFATPTEARFANGMTLIGYRLVAPALRIPKAGQVFDLYFRVDEPQTADLRIELRGDASPPGDKPSRDRNRYAPGDWSVFGHELEVGTIFHDRSLLRIRRNKEGSLDFSVALYAKGRRVEVEAARVVDGGAWLATQSYSEDAVRVFEYPGMQPPPWSPPASAER